MANAFQLAQFPRSTICDFVATVEWKIVDVREHKHVTHEHTGSVKKLEKVFTIVDYHVEGG